MTLLGDLAQAVGVWGFGDWSRVGEWLPTPDGVEVVELRYGYRSPAQVLELAGRLLPAAAPDVAPTEAVRPGRQAPMLTLVDHADLWPRLAAEVGELAASWPSVGVVAPAIHLDAVLGALGDLDVGEASVDGLGHRVTVVAAQGAKGLEFDAVAVVEPAAIVAERGDRPTGLRLLYVALTRPTQHLLVVATEEVPELAA